MEAHMKKVIDLQAQQIRFTFEGLEAVVLNVPKLSDDVLEYAQYHGLQARIGDNAAISRKGADGSVVNVTEAMRRDAVLELVNHYESGATAWELRTGKRAPAQSPTIAAIATKLGITYAEAEAKVAETLLAEME